MTDSNSHARLPRRILRTKVAIIGAGPAGLLLSQLLHQAGIKAVVIEQRSRQYVEARIRAGVLEENTIEALERAGVAGRMRREGLMHTGLSLLFDGKRFRIDLAALTNGKGVMVYGQTEIVKDLIDAHIARDAPLIFNAEAVQPADLLGSSPCVTFAVDGERVRIDCDFVAGCDGFHGVSRASIPTDVLRTYEGVYPFGWLGILADVPPCDPELIYCNHEHGFALASMRSPTRSRYYIQCGVDENVDDWSDDRFWDELCLRLGKETSASVTRGASIEKSIAPLRSFVAEPMRYGNLFLAGDAAHIVPPTGAKGLNLAVSDISLLADSLIEFYRSRSARGLENYSSEALRRVWKAERFSWWLTGLTHGFPEPIQRRLQEAEFDYLRHSKAGQTTFAENYVGLSLS
jgi:p-hydroxybenzoate 3-monooxygenase